MYVWFIQALVDIEIAIKMLKEGDYSENPVDRHYHSLKCDLEPLDHKSEEFKVNYPCFTCLKFIFMSVSSKF